ncbi:hypothetical protein, partial [Vibrio parahaemolyticus]
SQLTGLIGLSELVEMTGLMVVAGVGGDRNSTGKDRKKIPRRNKQQNEFILLNCKSPYRIRPAGAFLFPVQQLKEFP